MLARQSFQEQQVQAEGHLGGYGGLGLHGAIDGEQHVLHFGGAEIGGGGGAALGAQGEKGGELGEGAGGAVTSSAAQFDEIVRSGDGNQQAATGAEDATELGGLTAGGDGEHERERSVGEGQKAVGVGDNPFAVWVAAGGGCDRGDGDVDAVGSEAGLGREGSQVEAVAATGVENSVARLSREETGDGLEQRRGHAKVMEAAAGGYRVGSVSGVAGTAVLRL